MNAKRLLVTVAAAMMTFFTLSAQGIGSSRFGIIGGFTSSSADADVFSASSYNLYHAGLTFQVNLGAGFCIQPGLTYQVKGTELSGIDLDKDYSLQFSDATAVKSKVGYLELPVQVQWGPDLLAFRPYVFAEPFVGYAVNLNARMGDLECKDFKEAAMQRMEYGLGVGAGLELWRIQLSARYYWNFGSLYAESGKVNPVGIVVKEAFQDGRNFNGFSISAAIFF